MEQTLMLLAMTAAVLYVVWLGYNHQNPVLSLVGVILNSILLFGVMPQHSSTNILAGVTLVVAGATFVTTVCTCIATRRM